MTTCLCTSAQDLPTFIALFREDVQRARAIADPDEAIRRFDELEATALEAKSRLQRFIAEAEAEMKSPHAPTSRARIPARVVLPRRRPRTAKRLSADAS